MCYITTDQINVLYNITYRVLYNRSDQVLYNTYMTLIQQFITVI